jgi:predicted nucleic acid-binding protein
MKFPVLKLRLYLDTTIPSYLFALDSPARMQITQRFMRLIGNPAYELVISDVVLEEINRAAPNKRALLMEVVRDLRVLPTIPPAKVLAEAYIDAGALPKSSFEDALHVALATLYNLDALISWNFGHLVNIRRAKAIATVNAQRGLPHIEIITPEEVLV